MIRLKVSIKCKAYILKEQIWHLNINYLNYKTFLFSTEIHEPSIKNTDDGF